MTADTALAVTILGLFLAGLFIGCWRGVVSANQMLDEVIEVAEDNENDPETIPWRRHT